MRHGGVTRAARRRQISVHIHPVRQSGSGISNTMRQADADAVGRRADIHPPYPRAMTISSNMMAAAHRIDVLTTTVGAAPGSSAPAPAGTSIGCRAASASVSASAGESPDAAATAAAARWFSSHQ